MPLRGKQAGTRQLCRGRTSYRTAYTLHSAEHGDLSVPTAVVWTYQRRRSGDRQLRWLVYVCLGVGGRVIQVRKRYRRRFGIETGYRLMEQVRARTTSPKRGAAFPADGNSAADCEYVDPVGLAVPTLAEVWTTACGTLAVSARSDEALSHASG